MKITESLAFAVSAATAALAEFLAQAAPASEPFPHLDLGNLTATGILGWYAWHTAARTIPGLVKDFREEAREQREAFKEEMRIEREGHRQEVLELRRALYLAGDEEPSAE